MVWPLYFWTNQPSPVGIVRRSRPTALVQAVRDGLLAKEQAAVQRGVEARQVPDGRDDSGGCTQGLGEQFSVARGAALLVHLVREGHPIEHVLISLLDRSGEQVLRHHRSVLHVAPGHRVPHGQEFEQPDGDRLAIGLGHAGLDHPSELCEPVRVVMERLAAAGPGGCGSAADGR